MFRSEIRNDLTLLSHVIVRQRGRRLPAVVILVHVHVLAPPRRAPPRVAVAGDDATFLSSRCSLLWPGERLSTEELRRSARLRT